MGHTVHKFVDAVFLRPLGLLAVIGLVVSSSSSATVSAQNDAAQCRPVGPLVQVPGLSEASGLAVSRRTPGRLWTHNDSGEPVVVSVDARGSVTGRVRLTGAAVEDWEAIAVGPCGTGSCLHVADIGDNEARRTRITIYRLPEPEAANGSASVADVFHATYPDGAHDAETPLVGADGRLYVVTMLVEEEADDIERKAALASGSDGEVMGEAEVEFATEMPVEQEVEFTARGLIAGAVYGLFVDGREVAAVAADPRGRIAIELDVRLPGAP